MSRAHWLVFGAVTVVLVGAPVVPPGTASTEDGPPQPRGPDPSVAVTHVVFHVADPLMPLVSYTLHGQLYRPAAHPLCDSAVLVLFHGLSYARWAWDFPLRPDTYSMARHLAARGHAVLALDALGAGQSDHPNGYAITGQSQGMIAHEIVRQLRDGDYHGPHVTPFARVGLGGHSSGGDLIEFAAGLYGDGDVLIPMAWHHQGKPETTPEQTAGLVAAVATDDYVTFEPDLRAFLFYSDTAEADVVAKDNALAEGAPSGQFLTTGLVPGGASLAVMPLIEAPVLLLLAEKDRIFHPDVGDQELALFAGSSDKTLMVVPDAGHTFMLHPNAPSVHEAVAQWLDDHVAQMPAC